MGAFGRRLCVPSLGLLKHAAKLRLLQSSCSQACHTSCLQVSQLLCGCTTMLHGSEPAAKYWQQTSHGRTKNLYSMARLVDCTHALFTQVSTDSHYMMFDVT